MDGTQSIRRESLDGIRRKLLDRQRALFDDMECLKADLGILEEGREAELETWAERGDDAGPGSRSGA